VDAEGTPAQCRAELDRRAAELGPAPRAWKLIETTAGAAGRHRALAMLGPGGVGALLDGGDDLPPPSLSPAWETFAGDEAALFGAAAAHPALLPELCVLAARGQLPIARLVRPVTVEELPAALAARRSGRLHSLPILVPP